MSHDAVRTDSQIEFFVQLIVINQPEILEIKNNRIKK